MVHSYLHALVVIMFHMLLAECAFDRLSFDFAVTGVMGEGDKAVTNEFLY